MISSHIFYDQDAAMGSYFGPPARGPRRHAIPFAAAAAAPVPNSDTVSNQVRSNHTLALALSGEVADTASSAESSEGKSSEEEKEKEQIQEDGAIASAMVRSELEVWYHLHLLLINIRCHLMPSHLFIVVSMLWCHC